MLTGILAFILLIILVTIYHFRYHRWYSFLVILKYPIRKYNERKIKRYEEKIKEEKLKNELRKTLNQAEEIVKNELKKWYVSHSKYLQLKQKLLNLKERCKEHWYWEILESTFNEYEFCSNIVNNCSFIDMHNENFINTEKIRYWNEFWTLTPPQQEAIYSDEDAILVNAWAWTGKTKTIENKIKYLVKEKWISLDDILVVTYTKESQKDMKKRICKTLATNWIPYSERNLKRTITTFHAFWKWILDEYESKRHYNSNSIWKWYATKRVLDEDDVSVINRTIESIKKEPEIYQMIMNYFYYYDRQIVFDEEEWNENHKKREYSSYLKSWWFNVKVKSYWELLIANYLYVHWINAIYEWSWFHYTDEEWDQKDYKPDFYLPDYNIFIEYFWVDENLNTAPWISKNDYVEWMNKKIEAHKKSWNILIDLRYADLKLWRQSLLNALEKELIRNHVDLSNHNEIHHIVIQEKMSNLWKILSSFLQLYTWCRMNDKKIYERIEKLPIRERERSTKFYEIFKEYYRTYRSLLDKDNLMDFFDMILWAINHLNKWEVVRKFKYILVDEFQDITKARAALLLALIKDPLETKLFCVWDDWQSIYRFCWSELWLFLDFDNYFWYTKHITLNDTFRFNQWISNISWDFIQKNPAQIRKNLISKNQEHDDRVNIFQKENSNDKETYRQVIKNIFDDCINHFSDDDKIKYKTTNYEIKCLYLTRYKIERYKYNLIMALDKNKDNLNKELVLEVTYNEYKFKLHISHKTVHWAKWLEADYVIIDNVNWRVALSFPSTIYDDPVLDLCMMDTKFSYPFAEERRLFYVAITRWKNKAYILYNKYYRSIFINDIAKLLGWENLTSNSSWIYCNKCWWEVILSDPEHNEYICKKWCKWKYFVFNWCLYKAPLCNCWKDYSVLRINPKNWKPFRPCSLFPKCWKYHHFREGKYRIWYVNNKS